MENLLQNFGLDDGEAKLYYALLKLGEAKVEECAEVAGIGRTTAYSIMKRLLQKGLIAEISGNPLRLSPLPPKQALGPIINERLDKIRKLNQELPSIAQEIIEQAEKLYQSNPISLDNENDIMIVRGIATTQRIIDRCLSKTKSIIRNIVRHPLLVVYKSAEQEIAEYSEKGIDNRIIFEDAVLKNSQIAQDCVKYIENGVIVKHIEKAPAKLLILDDFASLTVIRQNVKHKHLTSLFSENRELIALQIFAFDSLWEKAPQLTIKKIKQIANSRK